MEDFAMGEPSRNIFERYDGFKAAWDQYAEKHPDSLISRGYLGCGRVVTFLAGRLPAPEKKLSDTFVAQYSKAAAAFSFAGALYDQGWFYNAASAAAIKTFSERSIRGEKRLAHDASIVLLAGHTLSAACNALKLWYEPSLSRTADFLFDLSAIVVLNTILNEPVAVKKD